MMRIKKSNFIDEVRDPYDDGIDVKVAFKDGYSYIIVVRSPMIVVKKLTKEIVSEKIQTIKI